MWKIKSDKIRGIPSDDDRHLKIVRIAIIENDSGKSIPLTSVRLVPRTAPRQAYRMAEEEAREEILAELDRINKSVERPKSEEKPSPTLKPCPFCGRPAELKEIPGSWGYYPDAVSIGCDTCKIKFMADTEAHDYKRGHYSIYDQAVSKVAAKWNTRHSGDTKGGTS